MEVVAAKLAAERRTAKQLDAMKALVNDSKSIKGDMTWQDKRKFDRRFQEIIWEASHNHILAKTLTNLKLICTRINTSLFADSISDEEGIALLNNAHRLMEIQDQAGLESLMHEHMLATVEHLKNFIFSKFTTVNMEKRNGFGT